MDVLTVPINLFQKAEEAFDLVWKLMNYGTEKEASKKKKYHPHFYSTNRIISPKEKEVYVANLFLCQRIQSSWTWCETQNYTKSGERMNSEEGGLGPTLLHQRF